MRRQQSIKPKCCLFLHIYIFIQKKVVANEGHTKNGKLCSRVQFCRYFFSFSCRFCCCFSPQRNITDELRLLLTRQSDPHPSPDFRFYSRSLKWSIASPNHLPRRLLFSGFAPPPPTSWDVQHLCFKILYFKYFCIYHSSEIRFEILLIQNSTIQNQPSTMSEYTETVGRI